VGYFNVPKAVSETGIEVWSEYDAELHAAAMRCAEEVGAAVVAGRFWPPAEDVRDDDFAGLVHGTAAESFDVSAWPETARGMEARGDRPEARGGDSVAPGEDDRRALP
jgi:hypothetical protein